MRYVPVEKRVIKRQVKLSWRLLAVFHKLIRPLFVKGIDPNEDFECGNCRRPLLKRFLTCSEACYHEIWRDVGEQMIEEAKRKAEEMA